MCVYRKSIKRAGNFKLNFLKINKGNINLLKKTTLCNINYYLSVIIRNHSLIDETNHHQTYLTRLQYLFSSSSSNSSSFRESGTSGISWWFFFSFFLSLYFKLMKYRWQSCLKMVVSILGNTSIADSVDK